MISGDCIFCRIVSGELLAEIVAENAVALAFRDRAPVAPAHLLVVPRDHVADASVLTETDGPMLGALVELAAEVARTEGLSGGYRLVFNVGEDAGNTVAHLHLHLIGGREMAWPPG